MESLDKMKDIEKKLLKPSKIIYTPNGPQVEEEAGLFHVSRLMWDELISARELIWRLVIRDFSARYRQSVFGIFWAVILPIVSVSIFIVINSAGVLNLDVHDIGIPYPLYVLIGLSIWNLFAGGLTSSSQALVNSGSIIVKINFPKVALILAATGQSLIDFALSLILIGLSFIYFDVNLNWMGLSVGLVCILPLYLLMTGIGFVLSLAAGVLRDMSNILNISLMTVMLLTPIAYPIKGDSALNSFNKWNPLNYLINVPRDLIVTGDTKFVNEFVFSSIFSVVVFYAGWKLFYIAQPKIAERI